MGMQPPGKYNENGKTCRKGVQIIVTGLNFPFAENNELVEGGIWIVPLYNPKLDLFPIEKSSTA